MSIPIPSPSINGIIGLSVSKDFLVSEIAADNSSLFKFSFKSIPLLLVQFW